MAVKVYTEAERQANADKEKATLAAAMATPEYRAAMAAPTPQYLKNVGNANGYTPTTSTTNSAPSIQEYTMVRNGQGEYSTVNNSVLADYIAKGYSTDLNKPLDYNSLAANSIYRTENQGQIGSQGAPAVSLINAPNGYKPFANTTVNSSPLAAQIGTAPKATDNSGMINSQYDSLVSALKSKIQQSINNKNVEIGGLGAKYQPQRNQSEVQRYDNLRSVLEQNVNNGDRGGVGRQNALETQTAASNRLNTIGLQQTADKTGLENDIANLGLESNIQEAQNQASRLKDLIANNQYEDTTAYNRSQDSIANNLAQQQATNNQTMADLQIKEAQDSAIEKQAAIDAQAHYNDIQAFINTLPPSDPRVPYLQAIRQGKITDTASQQQALQAAASKSQTAAQQANFDNALAMWKVNGVATQEIANILGIKVGARTADFSLDSIKAAKSGSGGSGSSGNSGIVSDSNIVKKIQSMLDSKTQKSSVENGQLKLENVSQYTNADIEAYIRSLSITPQEKADLANYFGL